MTSGKIQLRREPVELRAVVESAVETSRPAVDRGSHALTVRLPDAPLWLDADPVRLAQVLGNLITNAAKYTPDGGRIEVSADREGGEAVIRVTDTGVGIPADMLPRVFELFTQVGGHLDRSQGGLGIGLALARMLVELHGGSVTGDSPGPGSGSTFTVRLPASSPPERDPGGESEPQSGRSAAAARRILVVDDNQDGARTLSMLLAIVGHATATAHSGPEALAVARSFRPDVVFLDIGLPGMSGYDVAGRLRDDPMTRGATQIAVTGWGSQEDRRRSAEAGFAHHLTKPVDPAALTQLLSSL